MRVSTISKMISQRFLTPSISHVPPTEHQTPRLKPTVYDNIYSFSFLISFQYKNKPLHKKWLLKNSILNFQWNAIYTQTWIEESNLAYTNAWPHIILKICVFISFKYKVCGFEPHIQEHYRHSDNAVHTIRTCKPFTANGFQGSFFTTQTYGINVEWIEYSRKINNTIILPINCDIIH